jgi:hypothetical protein
MGVRFFSPLLRKLLDSSWRPPLALPPAGVSARLLPGRQLPASLVGLKLIHKSQFSTILPPFQKSAIPGIVQTDVSANSYVKLHTPYYVVCTRARGTGSTNDAGCV